MSRLLFAAARGARLEGRYHNWGDGSTEWRITSEVYRAGNRIHPDDEHLQYGPISTALRKRAETGKIQKADLPYMKPGFVMTYEEAVMFTEDASFDATFFVLLLAEALADEGL